MIRAFSAPFMKLTCKVCPRTWATWSFSPHPARPPLLCLWHYHQMTRIQKLVRGFLFRTSLIHASPFTAVVLTPNFETGVGIFELHLLCVKPTLEQLGLTLSALYLKSTGHILAKFNYLFSQGQRSIWPFFFFFFFTWLEHYGNRRWTFLCVTSFGGPTVEEYRNSDYTRPLTLFIEERPLCSGSRRQTVDCSSSFFSLFPPSCRDVKQPLQSFCLLPCF